MATILDTLRDVVSPDLVSRAASLLGESERSTSRGLGGAFPAILAGLLSKSSDSGAMRQTMDMLADPSIDSNLARNATSMLGAGGLAKSPIAEIGGRFLSLLFGPQQGSVAGALADHAGIKGSSASTLLGLAAPLVMSVLGDRVRRDGLNAAGLASLLLSQRDSILEKLPAGLSGLLGLAASHQPETAVRESVRQPAMRTLGWLPVALGLLLLAGLWAFMRERSNAAMASATAGLPGGVASASPRAGADLGTFKHVLPSNVEISAPATGIERQIVDFIEEPSKGVEGATWFNFDRLLFETGSVELKPESMDQLRNVAEILKSYPRVTVKIGGYTDNVGDPAANLKLSQDRASNVMGRLVELGVPADRMSAEGYGEQHPVADNSTEAGRQQNRRIALRVTQK